MRKLKKQFITTILTTFIMISPALASGSSSVVPADVSESAPSISKSAYYQEAPLSCDIIMLGSRPPQGVILDLESFRAKPILSAPLIDEYFLTISKKWEFLTVPSSGWSTEMLPDLNNISAANYFKCLLTSYMDTPQISLSRRSAHMNTKFHPLQDKIYTLMNTEILSVTHMSAASLKPRGRMFRPVTVNTQKDAPDVSGRTTRSMTPKEKLITFIELIKRLRDNGRYIFVEDTIEQILKVFLSDELIVTNVQTLLIANGSDIPSCSGGHLNPGDLGILIELFADPKTGARRHYLLAIHNNHAEV